MAVTGRRMGDVIVGLSILFLGLLIIARIETGHGVTLHGPFVAVDGDTLADRGCCCACAGSTRRKSARRAPARMVCLTAERLRARA